MTPIPRKAIFVIETESDTAGAHIRTSRDATLGFVRDDVVPWTVLTWNVRGSAGPDLDAVATRIAAESPDVVALQEIRRSQATSLAHSLSMRYSWAFKHHPFTPAMWWLAEGMSIMSPHALDAAGHTELSEGRSSWSWRRRIAQWALVGRPDRSALRIYNLHLSPHDAPAARRAEAVRLTSIVTEHGTEPPAVVAGDFNDADDPQIIYALPGIEHMLPPDTNPSDSPTQLLDHVLLPPEAHGVAVTVPAGGAEWAALSDHLPVTVRFEI
jgi:endonuclease/exonuclease/phosphatase family metal-dependent hydrolase